MNRKIVIFGIILVGFITAAMGLQTLAAGTGISLKAFKVTEITDLYISYDDKNLSLAERVKINAFDINGSKKYTEVYTGVAILNGTSIISLTNLNQYDRIVVEVVIGSGKSRTEMTDQTTVKLRPDLTIQNIVAPATALSTGNFNVNLSVAELNNDTGASFTVLIKEGDTTLASTSSSVAAGGDVPISIPLQITQVGIHNLAAVIVNSDPAETSTGNNLQNFSVEIINISLNQADYTTWYYSQNDDYHNSKNLNSAVSTSTYGGSAGTHIEVSDYIETKISERFYYKLTINKELIFPIDSLYIQISNEYGTVEEHLNTNIVPTKVENGNTIASLYYPETGSTLTITSTSGSTEIKLEKRFRYQQIVSSGYNYYSSSDNSTWNSSFINQTGTLINSRIMTSVNIELIDDGIGYGGIETMNLTVPIYSNSTWNDAGISGYRNIATYYIKQAGRTST